MDALRLRRVRSDWRDTAALIGSVEPVLRGNGNRLRQLLSESDSRL